MEELNEEAVAFDTDIDQELEEAWRTKWPDHLWNTNHDGVPPFSEVLTNEAKQHYISQGIHPDQLEWNDILAEELDNSRYDSEESKEELYEDAEKLEFMREITGNPFWPESG